MAINGLLHMDKGEKLAHFVCLMIDRCLGSFLRVTEYQLGSEKSLFYELALSLDPHRLHRE